jgi:hypothetical protein
VSDSILETQPTPGGTNPWTDDRSVFFTSFWGWSPETWGTVGFSNEAGKTRRSNLLRKLTDPFICVCYVTSNKSYIDPKLKGMIAGFYIVSHETGDRDAFTHPIHHTRDPKKWRHSLRAKRAFSYLPEYRISAESLDPSISKRARSISAMGEEITDTAVIRRLRDTPWVEVEVYSGVDEEPTLNPFSTATGKVRPGPAAKHGYEVAAGVFSLPRELYVLRLLGSTDSYLGKSADGRSIFKIGLSVSPELRRQSFQKAMPRGAFSWAVERTSRNSGLELPRSFDATVAGENAIKDYLASTTEHLGGEFYLASDADIDAAWKLGLEAASGFRTKVVQQSA